jgi:hypothetical protein
MTIATKPFLIPQALLDYVDQVALGLDMPVARPEINADPETDDNGQIKPFLRIDYLPNRLKWEGLASGRIDQGLLQITVTFPPNRGILAPAEIIGQVLAAFAKGATLQADDVTVRIDKEPWVSAQISESDRVGYPISIPWIA